MTVTTHRLHLIIRKIREMVEPEGITEALAVQGIYISTREREESKNKKEKDVHTYRREKIRVSERKKEEERVYVRERERNTIPRIDNFH